MINISNWNIEEGYRDEDTGEYVIPMDIPEEDLKWIWDNYEMTYQEYLTMILENAVATIKNKTK